MVFLTLGGITMSMMDSIPMDKYPFIKKISSRPHLYYRSKIRAGWTLARLVGVHKWYWMLNMYFIISFISAALALVGVWVNIEIAPEYILHTTLLCALAFILLKLYTYLDANPLYTNYPMCTDAEEYILSLFKEIQQVYPDAILIRPHVQVPQRRRCVVIWTETQWCRIEYNP